MAGAFVDLNGNFANTRPLASSTAYVSPEDAADTTRLAELITDLSKRVAALEGNRAPDYIEFEKQVTAAGSGNVSLQHNFGCPVRFSVSHWKGVSNYSFNVNETLSTDNTLSLNSLVAGRVVLRVEKAQANVVKGS